MPPKHAMGAGIATRMEVAIVYPISVVHSARGVLFHTRVKIADVTNLQAQHAQRVIHWQALRDIGCSVRAREGMLIRVRLIGLGLSWRLHACMINARKVAGVVVL
mmetsp:Transcript_112725/g.195572  ORF Transcript_112725/g.195572 Transcript_112725/m.195572 type:complete len:105 (-) Transcript_112725:49-363(-)